MSNQYEIAIAKQNKAERDRVWAQGHASGWNAAIEEVLKIWDDIGPNETDVEIGERFKGLKK